MISLIAIELKMFFRQRKNWLVLICLVLLSTFFIHSHIKLNQMNEEYRGILLSNNISHLQDAILRMTNESNEIYTNEIERLNQEITYMQNMQNALLMEDWNEYLRNEIASERSELEGILSGSLVSSTTVEELEESIAIKEILIDKNIKPIFTEYAMSSWNFIPLFLTGNTMFLIVFVIIYFASSIVASDFEKGTYKLVYNLPLSKLKIYLSKLITALAINYAWVFTFLLGCFGILSIIVGTGDGNYPYKLHAHGTDFYVSAIQFVGMASGVLLLLITFIVCLTIGLSIFLRHSHLTFIITVAIIFGLNRLVNPEAVSDYTHLNPMIYLDITNTLKGDLILLFKNAQINLNTVVPLLVILSLLIILISSYSFKKMKLSK
ncbi:MAG: ABC transporter permease subunit [Turicibacter sp.]|nr:ABC transporter permease subunit [Turicibacter sp.]